MVPRDQPQLASYALPEIRMVRSDPVTCCFEDLEFAALVDPLRHVAGSVQVLPVAEILVVAGMELTAVKTLGPGLPSQGTIGAALEGRPVSVFPPGILSLQLAISTFQILINSIRSEFEAGQFHSQICKK